jgi:RNA polymerase sigma-70 factor (ECF subfamily)
MNRDDDPLIVRARNREQQAVTELVERHYLPVYAFLRRLAGNDTDAADLTQQTFARVWTALARFAGRSSISSWLHGIAHHVYLDWLRSNHRHTSASDDWWENCRDPRAEPDVQVAQADLAAVLYAAVDRLEPDLRSTVHLHHYQGLTLDETAEALGVSASTVKYRLRGALEQLQKRLAEEPNAVPNLPLIRRL